jgi:ActR/RegA family two-component response regulator
MSPAPERIAILVVEDDEAFAGVLTEELLARGHSVDRTDSVADACERLQENAHDVALLDLQLPDGSGLDVLREIAAGGLAVEALILTGYAEVPTALEAMRLGAYDYLSKPPRLEELHVLVAKAAEKARLRRENVALRVRLRRHESAHGFVTDDPVAKQLLVTLARAAPSPLPVLIQGETGTGKELLARALHDQGPRATFPFVPINCAALPENLIESELFGHERGAFTGAIERKTGLFEVATRGTVFLDEIGELSFPLQARLLRVLETQEFFRVGGTRPVRVDVRVVSATHRDLRAEIEAGRFREDLFYRLNGVTLRVPPLRERRGDIASSTGEAAAVSSTPRPSTRSGPTTGPATSGSSRWWWGARPFSHPAPRSRARIFRSRSAPGRLRASCGRTSRSPTWNESTSWPPSRGTGATAAVPPRCWESTRRRSTTSFAPGACPKNAEVRAFFPGGPREERPAPGASARIEVGK